MLAGAFAGLIARSVHVSCIGIKYPVRLVAHIYVQSFCIAPLDVLKIRLQLQVHPLAGPETQCRDYKRLRSGTFNTFKSILLEEGVTVRIPHPLISLTVS